MHMAAHQYGLSSASSSYHSVLSLVDIEIYNRDISSKKYRDIRYYRHLMWTKLHNFKSVSLIASHTYVYVSEDNQFSVAF